MKPPIELYKDPVHRKHPQAEHDLTKKEVQARVLAQMEGAEGANVYWIASPCTSYCDWQLKNGGSRSFTNPEGTGEGPLAEAESTGNILSNFSAEAFLHALQTGNFPVAESSAPSGRYPKQWDLPSWQAIWLDQMSKPLTSQCAHGTWGLQMRTMPFMCTALGWSSLSIIPWRLFFDENAQASLAPIDTCL